MIYMKEAVLPWGFSLMYADVLWTYPKSPALPCNLSLIPYQNCETGPCPRGGTLKGKRIDMKEKKKDFNNIWFNDGHYV